MPVSPRFSKVANAYHSILRLVTGLDRAVRQHCANPLPNDHVFFHVAPKFKAVTDLTL
jgi:hypothetical protein